MSSVSREEPRFCDLCDISLDLHPNPADVQHPEDCAVADRMLGLR